MLSLFFSQNDKSQNEKVNCRGFGRDTKLGQWVGLGCGPVVYLVVKLIDYSGSNNKQGVSVTL